MTRTAERLALRALERLHREQPLAASFRADLIAARATRSASAPRARSHRGSASLDVTPHDVRGALASLAERGEVRRSGRRFALAGREPRLDPETRRRADLLLDRLRAAAGRLPPVARLAREMGIPGAALTYLRESGELVSVAQGIDYPADVLRAVADRLVEIARPEGSVSVARFRDALGIGRRHAVALLEYFDAIGVTRREGDEHRIIGPRDSPMG